MRQTGCDLETLVTHSSPEHWTTKKKRKKIDNSEKTGLMNVDEGSEDRKKEEKHPPSESIAAKMLNVLIKLKANITLLCT